MKKIFLVWVIYSCSILFAFAQSSLPPVYEIKSDTALSQKLDSSFWQKLEDKEGKWTFEDVSKSPLSEKFHKKGLKAAGIDTNKIYTVWTRYRLRNTMSHDANFSLTSYVDYYDVYLVKNDSSLTHYKSGFLRKWEEKDGLKSAGDANVPGIGPGAIPFVLKPGEEILIYDKRFRHKNPNFSVSVRILNTEKLIRENYIDYVDNRENYFGKVHLQEAFVLGLLLLAIFLNLFFFKIVREKVYLHFSLFAIFLAINRLWNISFEYTNWENYAMLQYVTYLGFAWAFIPYFFLHFFRNFLQTKSIYPKWDKVLIVFAFLNVAVFILAFLSSLFFENSFQFFLGISSLLSFLLIPLLILITLLLFIRKKDRSIRYLIIGAFPLLTLYLITSPLEALGIELKFAGLLMENFRLIEVICISWLVLSFSLILLMRFDRLRKENSQQALDNEKLAREKETERTELIEKQKNELEIQVEERTADLKNSIEELKSTQHQLIQSEKMASLGELTAGIAHEIQNPLNFVNNFSEVSVELIKEMVDEVEKGNTVEVKDIAADLVQNLEKINHHGKRADAIVKGMLQHSRSSNGQKEPTDINALADEYLRLAYHGLRAKDKTFNATLKTDYDDRIDKINVIPQDIGRVILNLITNAFYVVNEKALSAASAPTEVKYEPTVSVSTKKEGNNVIISVKDNGNGIPQKLLDKIFQPFFTTKPTGQGTGLGLSLSYDILKAHGGELRVETKEREGSTFIIQIPTK